MHILYVDEAGTQREARHFVVAGLSLFERQTYHLAEDIFKIQAAYFPEATEPLELHASKLRAPNEHAEPPFNSVDRTQRFRLLDDVCETIIQAQPRLFGVAIEKGHLASSGDDPYELGFEQIVSRFDRMLGRVNRERGEDNRGLVVLAESSYRETSNGLLERSGRRGTGGAACGTWRTSPISHQPETRDYCSAQTSLPTRSIRDTSPATHCTSIGLPHSSIRVAGSFTDSFICPTGLGTATAPPASHDGNRPVSQS